MASLPSLYSSLSGYKPRSPQGDGSYQANGMQQVGQMGAFGSGGGMQMPQTMPRPRQAPQGGQGQLPAQGGAQTFAQMQNQGVARPTPQMVGAYQPSPAQGQATNQLQQAVAQTLQTPSRYDLSQVQQVRDALTGQLNTEFGAKRKEIDETLAKRGLLSSSYAGGYYGDLAGQQANAMATMNANLIQDAARNWSQDNATALTAAGSLQNNLANQGVAAYGANAAGVAQNNAARLAQQQFGLDRDRTAQEMALKQGELMGTFGGQQTQAAKQFDVTSNLDRLLGVGDLALKQNQQAIEQQQFGQNFGLAQQKAELDRQVQTGQLSVQQASQRLAELQNAQQYGLAGQAQSIQQEQFNKNLELQRAELTQKYGAAEADRQIEAQRVANQQAQFGQQMGFQREQLATQSRQADLDRALQQLLGVGGLDVQRQQVANQATQFGQSLQEQQAARMQNAGITQQELALKAQQLQQDAALQGRSLTIQEAQNQAQNQLEAQRMAQQGQQFGQSLDLDRLKLQLDQQVQMGQLSVQQASQKLDEARLAAQNQQFGQSLQEQVAARLQSGQQFQQGFSLDQAKLDLDRQVQTGQLSIQQANQKLAELANAQQNRLATQAQANQVDQFGRSLAQQYAQMGQQNTQFNASQTQNQQQFNADLIARLASILGDENYIGGNNAGLTSAIAGLLGGNTYGAPPVTAGGGTTGGGTTSAPPPWGGPPTETAVPFRGVRTTYTTDRGMPPSSGVDDFQEMMRQQAAADSGWRSGADGAAGGTATDAQMETVLRALGPGVRWNSGTGNFESVYTGKPVGNMSNPNVDAMRQALVGEKAAYEAPPPESQNAMVNRLQQILGQKINSGEITLAGGPRVTLDSLGGQTPDAQGRIASGDPFLNSILSMSPLQRWEDAGVYYSPDASAWKSLGLANAQGQVIGADGRHYGQTTPGAELMQDTASGRYLTAEQLKRVLGR